MLKDFRPEALYSHMKAHKLVQQGWFLFFFFCNFDDQLSPNCHRFVTVCFSWDTPSENTGPNFIELLKHNILLKQKIHCLVKSDYQPRYHSIVMLSKQQLNTISHKQCIWHDILASNMCKISELFSCLSKFFC